MVCSNSLSAFQGQVLGEFFARERGFFLTGGAALVGYYLGHRRTDDLDLFTTDKEAFERGDLVLRAVAAALGAHLVVRRTVPGFRRLVLTRGEDAVVVDLVLDPSDQLLGDKVERDGVVLDPREEILANKLSALAGRGEIRDLVDVMALEASGLRVEDALAAAQVKDGGCTPATLAWVLSQLELSDQARVPGGVAVADLRRYVDDLVRRLRAAAFPAGATQE